MRLYQVRVDIYEPGTAYPIVVHTFQGGDRAAAERIYAAHRRADRFLRECVEKGVFATNVPCRAKVYRGWVTL